jgi:hypothetical protein
MSDDTITVNEVGLHLAPIEWVTFRKWAGYEGYVGGDSTLSMDKIKQFKGELRRAVFELYLWNRKNADHFTARLFGLIGKADRENQFKLSLGFPIEVLAWHLWQASEREDEFFRKYEVGKMPSD